MVPSVFIIDDDPDQLSLVEAQLKRSRRYEVHGFTSADEALSHLEVESPLRIGAPTGTAPIGPGVTLPMGLTLQEVEKRYIAATLEDAGGNISEAAEQLGITRKLLWLRRKQYGMEETQ